METQDGRVDIFHSHGEYQGQNESVLLFTAIVVVICHGISALDKSRMRHCIQGCKILVLNAKIWHQCIQMDVNWMQTGCFSKHPAEKTIYFCSPLKNLIASKYRRSWFVVKSFNINMKMSSFKTLWNSNQRLGLQRQLESLWENQE